MKNLILTVAAGGIITSCGSKIVPPDPEIEFLLPASYTLNEDSPTTTLDSDLLQYVENADNPIISIINQSNPQLVTAFLNGAYDLIAKDLEADGNGENKVTVQVKDGTETVQKETTVYVDPVNDAPTLTKDIPDTSMTERTYIMIDLSNYFSDIDDENLTYSVYDSPLATFIDGDNLKIVSDGGFGVMQDIYIEASDGEYSVFSNKFDITVNPASGNWPVSIDLPDIVGTIQEDDPNITNNSAILIANLDDYVSDNDVNETFTYEITYQSWPNLINIYIDGKKLMMENLHENWFGENSVEIKVTDSGGDTSTDYTKLVVEAVNDAPHNYSSVPNFNMNANNNLTINGRDYFSDIDGDTLDYVIKNLVNATQSETNNIITVTPTPEWTGTISDLYIEASDGEYSVQGNNFYIQVNP